jgi:membrane protease subunit HflK
LILLALWAISDMVYIINPAERGVVLRFGRYVATLEAGLNFRLPRPIERVEIINTDQIRSINHKATTLTQDENIVDIELAVQYNVNNVYDYLFNIVGPDLTLEQATESTVRTVIGENKMDYILTEGRAQIGVLIEKELQRMLDAYKAGVLVTSVNMQPIRPPEEVKSAFDDVIRAREDRERLINEAESYSNDILPKAQGAAARQLAEANAYKSKLIAEAEGESSRFQQLLTQYELAPDVTRKRLYLETVESVFSHTNKVLLDAKGGNNLMYLPLDKMIQPKLEEHPAPADETTRNDSPPAGQPSPSRRETPERYDARTRGAR